jgi:hypothetical protein
VTYALCFAFGVLLGYFGHRAEVAQERRKDVALGRVFDRDKLRP